MMMKIFACGNSRWMPVKMMPPMSSELIVIMLSPFLSLLILYDRKAIVLQIFFRASVLNQRINEYFPQKFRQIQFFLFRQSNRRQKPSKRKRVRRDDAVSPVVLQFAVLMEDRFDDFCSVWQIRRVYIQTAEYHPTQNFAAETEPF